MKTTWLLGTVLFATSAYAAPCCKKKQEVCPLPYEWGYEQYFSRNEVKSQVNSSGKPEWFVKDIQPLYFTPESYRHAVFLQGQWVFQSGQVTLSPGFGYRFLSYCEKYLVGVNGFYDIRRNHTMQRASLGFDVHTHHVDFAINFYRRLSNWGTLYTRNGVTTTQKPLNGLDTSLSIPVLYMPWLRLSFGYYHWNSISFSNIRGFSFSTKADLWGPFSIEGGMTRDQYKHNNYLQFSVRFGFPNRIEYSLANTPIAKTAFPDRKLQRLILDPVVREALITGEIKETGSSGITIGRGNR